MFSIETISQKNCLTTLGRSKLKDDDLEKLTHAKQLCRNGDYESSFEIVRSIIANQEHTDILTILDALILEAELSWKSGKLDEGFRSIDIAQNLMLSDRVDLTLREFQEKQGRLLSQAGVIHWYKGDIEEALKHHKESLRIRETLNDKEGIAIAYNNLGLVFWTKGDFDQATAYYEDSLAIYNELGDEGGVSRVLNNLANISSSRGELDPALSYYQQSLEIKERIANKKDIATSLINIGVIHRLKGNLDKATEYYNRSLNLLENLSIGPEFALGLNNLGEIFNLKGELDTALDFYQRSLLIYDAMGAKEGIALALHNMGDIQKRKGNHEIAFEYFQRSLAISEKMENSRLISVILFELIRIAIDNNDSDQAMKFFQRLEEIDAKSDNRAINQQYRLANALILKTSSRTRERVKAEEILEELIDEEPADHTIIIDAMVNLCELLLLELKAARAEETLQKVNELTRKLVVVASEQSSHSLVVESYLLQSKLALLNFKIKQAQDLMTQAKKLAHEKGLYRLESIVDREIKTLQNDIQRWESILEVNPPKQELVSITNLDDLLRRMVQKTVENLEVSSTTGVRKSKYNLVHLNLLEGTDKAEKSRFRVGIAQIGLSKDGDILSEQYEEKREGLIGLKEEEVTQTREKIRDFVERAHSDGLKILIFPEMTIDLYYYEFSQDISKLARDYDMYIIPGSFHDQESKRNICRIFGPNGVLWEQEKHIPAVIHIEGKRFIERINTESRSKKTTICDTEYGRIAIAICRDFLDMDLRVELKNSDPPVDLIINPAFTPVTEDFRAAHFDARRSIYAYCFFANVAEFGNSLIYTPEKERIERNIPKREEGIIYKDVDLFQLRSERKKWEDQQKQNAFIQSTR